MERRELEQLFAFDRWANRQTLEALRGLEAAPEELRDLTWHVFTAQDTWISRIEGSQTLEPPIVWGEDRSIEDLERYLARLEPKTAAFVAAIEDQRLNDEFDYQNTSGVPFTNVVSDVLQHVILHGVEHRAQVMREVGELGDSPVELEYAWFLRDRPAGC